MPDLPDVTDLPDLRALHHADTPLVLANVWDPGTAKLVAAAGFPAVATSSAAVAEANGYSDHEEMPADVAFAAVRAIAQAVPDVPVTADMESGYGLPPAEFATRLVEAGAKGCNYEDTDHANPGTLLAPEFQAERIAAIRAAQPDLVINARVDTFLTGDKDPDDALRRARLYVDAGADCVYPIILSDEALIARFVEEVDAPVNILLFPHSPPLARLVELGVRRISVGSGLFRRAIKTFTDGLEDLKLSGG